MQEKGGEAAQWTAARAGEAGGVIADKASDVGGVVADEAGDVADAAKDKAAEAKDLAVRKGKEVGSAAAEKAGQVQPLPSPLQRMSMQILAASGSGACSAHGAWACTLAGWDKIGKIHPQRLMYTWLPACPQACTLQICALPDSVVCGQELCSRRYIDCT